MKIVATHSIDADTAYLAFGDDREVVETVAPMDDVAIDLDAEGRIVGIEFVTASRVLHPSALQDSEKDELIGVTEIAEILGRRKQNVAQHYTRKEDFPRPVAELPTGRYWRRGDVEAWWESSAVGRAERAETAAIAEAAEWLTNALAAGGRSVNELRSQSTDHGIEWSALSSAASAIGVDEEHRKDDQVIWRLPAGHPAAR